MKKHTKSKLSFAIFIDFIFITILFSILCGAFFIGKQLLFPEDTAPSTLTVRTEFMPVEYTSELFLGDDVFDTLTKRKVGKITGISCEEDGDLVRFHITLDSKFTPRGRSLRTRRLWFYFARESV